MASYQTPIAIISAFISRQKTSHRLASLVVTNDTIYSFGPHYPLIVRDEDGALLVNETPYVKENGKISPTTNRHITAAQIACRSHAYRPCGKTRLDDYPDFIFTVYA